MPRSALRALALGAFFLTSAVVADYDTYFFSSNASSWQCPGMSYECAPPQICVHDAVLDKHYCCGGGSGSVCWSGAQDCSGNNGEAANGQLGCGDNNKQFCCYSQQENCTQRRNQINICWAAATDPIQNLTDNELNATFSSLVSASPTASKLTFNLNKLLSTATSAPASSVSASGLNGPTSGSAMSTSSSSASASASASATHSSSSGISGGAIGGIVVGVVAGIALIGAGAFFFWRRNSNKAHGNELDGESNPYLNNGYGAVAQTPPVSDVKYAHEAPPVSEAPATPAATRHAPVEMEGTPAQPVEVEGSHPVPR